MLVDLKEILTPAQERGYAVPAFNIYNMETVTGVIRAAEELRSPVILQFYSRLATTGVSDYLCPVCLEAARRTRVPVCVHLDHGASEEAAAIAVRNGASGIMVDFSKLPLGENAARTARVAALCRTLGIGVEGELGQIGRAADGVLQEYTDPNDAAEYVQKTGVSALAVAVGTAHGRYRRQPVLAIGRIAEIKEAARIPVVLHGGSGVPDDQIRAAVGAGIAKVNFGTDLCYSFLDRIFETDRSLVAIDLFMEGAIGAVQAFAESKIRLLNAEGKA